MAGIIIINIINMLMRQCSLRSWKMSYVRVVKKQVQLMTSLKQRVNSSPFYWNTSMSASNTLSQLMLSISWPHHVAYFF